MSSSADPFKRVGRCEPCPSTGPYGPLTHDLDNPMTPEQYQLALQLIALLEDDPEGQANCKAYGNWLNHLANHCADMHLESLRSA